MDELWARIAIIAAFLLVVSLVVAVRRRMALKAPRRVPATGLVPGIYLFTSGDCADCATAREKLEDMVGKDGYREVAWNQTPDIFTALGVEAVPATMFVETDGEGLLWLGQPDPARFGP